MPSYEVLAPVWSALARGKGQTRLRAKTSYEGNKLFIIPHSWHGAKHDVSILKFNYEKKVGHFIRHPGQQRHNYCPVSSSVHFYINIRALQQRGIINLDIVGQYGVVATSCQTHNCYMSHIKTSSKNIS